MRYFLDLVSAVTCDAIMSAAMVDLTTLVALSSPPPISSSLGSTNRTDSTVSGLYLPREGKGEGRGERGKGRGQRCQWSKVEVGVGWLLVGGAVAWRWWRLSYPSGWTRDRNISALKSPTNGS